MDKRLVALLFLAALAAAAYPTLGAPPAPPQTRYETLTVTAVACPYDDGVCLAYDGIVPGPTLDLNLGDTLVVTLENQIAATIANATNDITLISYFQNASVSWHVHGTALGADVDGILAHPGTQLVESVAPPGGSFTYTVRLAFVGSWHYHDHVLGPDGSEGVARGLYGSLLVRSGAEARADHVFDLHMVNAGANGGRNLTGSVAAGESFEVSLVGLGNLLWSVTLRDPSNANLQTIQVGPGMSDRFRVDNAEQGTYRLRAFNQVIGTIEVS